MTRLQIAIALLAALIAMPTAFAAPVFAGPVNPDLLPDLTMAPLFNVYVSTTPGGRQASAFRNARQQRRRRGDRGPRQEACGQRDDARHSVRLPR